MYAQPSSAITAKKRQQHRKQHQKEIITVPEYNEKKCTHPIECRIIDSHEGTEVCEECSYVVTGQLYSEEVESTPFLYNEVDKDVEVETQSTSSQKDNVCITTTLTSNSLERSNNTNINISTDKNVTTTTALPTLMPITRITKIRKTNVKPVEREVLIDFIANGHLPMSILATSLQTFSNALAGGAAQIKKGKCSRPALLAHSLYTACRMSDECNRSVKEIASITGISAKIIWKMDDMFAYRPPRNLFRDKTCGILIRTSTELRLTKLEIRQLRKLIGNMADYAKSEPSVFAASLVRAFSLMKGKHCSSLPHRRTPFLGRMFGVASSTIISAASKLIRNEHSRNLICNEIEKKTTVCQNYAPI
jgi:transcription initiation factor TFIIIB Brf1 subunit/transcription initiation factor TFIIB